MKNLKKPKPRRHPITGKWGCDFEEVVNGQVERRRKYHIYTEKSDAEIHCNKIYNQQNPKVRQTITTLTNAQQQEALWAFEELARFDVQKNSLRSAIQYYVAHYKEGDETRSVEAVVKDWLAIKEKQLAPLSYAPLRSRLKQFQGAFPCKFGEVSGEDLIEFVEKQSPGMKKKWLVHLGQLYGHVCNPANPKRELDHNPWDQVAFYFKDKLPETSKVPTILHLDEVKAALKSAMGFKSDKGDAGEFLGVVVLGLFCGLRPSEIQNLGKVKNPYLDYIQLNKGQIRITEEICQKTRSVRTVELKANSLEWLKYIQEKKLPICPNPYKYQKYNGALREKILGTRSTDKAWNDVYRHTFVTFLYNSAIESKEKLSFDYILSQVGHSMQVQEKHYRGILLDDENAPDFWKITPSSVQNPDTN